ncbi:hypothetical protein BDZ91DRAFT_850730 [Kalaharituber pfeilii]|nr:hypothetical protein BDZ91DRAFT_850730 [Kalaharituber pfeilii]
MTEQRARWSELMEDTLLTFLQQQVALGKRASDNSFKSKTWDDALPVIKAVMPEDYSGPDISAKKIQQKWDNMKKDYAAFKLLKSPSSGVGWDDAARKVTCSEAVWSAFVQKHRGVAKFRFRGLRNFDRMGELLEKRATQAQPAGEYARSRARLAKRAAAVSSPAPTEEQQEEEEEGEDEVQEVPVTKRARTASLHTPRSRGPHLLASAIDSLAHSARTKVRSQAIHKLQLDYPELDPEEMAAVFEIFEDEAKAEMFMAMKQGPAQTLWIRRQLERAGVELVEVDGGMGTRTMGVQRRLM